MYTPEIMETIKALAYGLDADEIAANCGMGLLASIHAESVEELRLKPLWQELLRAEVFRRCVVIRANGGARSYEVSALPCSV